MTQPLCFGLWIALILLSPVAAEVPLVDQWNFSLRKPPQDWAQPDFQVQKWPKATAGLGTIDTPNARVGKVWNTKQIWLRKTMDLDELPDNPAWLIHHDEDVEVYLNGKLALKRSGYVTDYQSIPLDSSAQAALKIGRNLLAVHCRQTGGGQFIDVHLIESNKRPKLPAPPALTDLFQSELITRWGTELTAENAWTEYPRPQLTRQQWTNLNGWWDIAITPESQVDAPEIFSQQLLVPFCLESKLGGVRRMLLPTEALWYRRSFVIKPSSGTKTLLNFEAVDYRCEVFVNGKSVGKHQGGNTPFSLDITSAVVAGENQLLVRVEDETEGLQLRGKQVMNPRGIFYTQVSGIWQTVWMEQVPTSSIEDLKISSDATSGLISVIPSVKDPTPGLTFRMRVLDGDRSIAEVADEKSLSVKVTDAKLWSPDSPHLYDLQVELLDAQGDVVDRVGSYAGIRTVSKMKDANGHWRMTLNGEPIFHFGPLDQGWWPDGLLTPPSDEAMLWDVEYLKAAGFNMIRKHIKVEPRRFYAHCDRLGMMVWQDQVSGGQNPPWTRMAPQPTDANWSDENHEQFMTELERMIDSLENHPSIVVWVPFNEAWGQHRTMQVGRWAVDRDPSRLINIASGGNFWPIGDIADHHEYPHPAFPFDTSRFSDFISVVGEFGGHGYPVPGHLWDNDRDNWGYGGLPQTMEEYRERYAESIRRLIELKQQGIAAGVYTQTTDVEGEINGLITYDREVIKIPAEDLKELHAPLYR